MNEFLSNVSGYLQSEKPDARIVISSSADDMYLQFTPPEFEVYSSELVEDNQLTLHEVGFISDSKVTHFMDGIQRSKTLYFDKLIPVVYAYLAAGVRSRKDRAMFSEMGWETAKQALFLPYYKTEMSKLRERKIECVDTVSKVEDQKEIIHYGKLQQLAANAVANERAKLERSIVKKWVYEYNSSNKWLIVDGSISRQETICSNMIGLIKKTDSIYFNSQRDIEQIYNLKPGQRTSVFIPITKNDNSIKVHSWYTKLSDKRGSSPGSGLVRIEMEMSPFSVQMADEVTGWLLQEINPSSLPDPRSDRLIYPIYDVEQYLNSKAPTHLQIESALMYVNK